MFRFISSSGELTRELVVDDVGVLGRSPMELQFRCHLPDMCCIETSLVTNTARGHFGSRPVTLKHEWDFPKPVMRQAMMVARAKCPEMFFVFSMAVVGSVDLPNSANAF